MSDMIDKKRDGDRGRLSEVGCQEVDKVKVFLLVEMEDCIPIFFKGMGRYILKYGECADKN